MKLLEGNRLVYIDILKILAILSVILIHISAPLFYSYFIVNPHWWWIGHIVDSASRWGVPIFLMVSGSTLLAQDKLDESPSVFFRKRFKRILIPFIAWSMIYFFWGRKDLINLNIYSIIEGIEITIQGGVYYHLYFLYYLLGLYLVTPILRIYLKSAKQRDINYFLILWFVANIIYPNISKFLGIRIGIPIYMVTDFVGYYLIGYYISNFKLNNKYKRIIFILGFFAFLLTIIVTYFLTKEAGIPDEWFYSYLNVGVIFPAIAVFVYFQGIDWERILENKSGIKSLVQKISATTFGIYLLHPIILEILNRYNINFSLIHPLYGIPISLTLTFLISFFIILFFQKIPLIRSII